MKTVRLLACCLCLGLGAPAELASDELHQVDGAAAPPGTWTTAGGSASGSGMSLTEVPRGEVEVAWRYRASGQIEGEPLVWGDRVLLACHVGGQKRVLEWVDLERGVNLGRREFQSSLPLEPALWNDLIALRSEPGQISFLRSRGKGFTTIGKFAAEGGVCSAPLLYRAEAYFIADRQLMRLTPGRNQPSWTSGGGYVGRPSLRGEHVYGLRYDESGNAELVQLRRVDGQELAGALIGHHEGHVPGIESGGRLELIGDHARVHFGLPVPLQNGSSADLALVEVSRGALKLVTLLQRGLAAVPAPGGWIEYTLPEAPRLAQTRIAELVSQVLATDEAHPEFLDRPVDLSRAGQTVLAGGRAFDLDDHSVLWRTDLAPRTRAVPADGAVLCVTSPNQLTVLRAAQGPTELGGSVLVRDTDLAASTAEAALRVRIVLLDGEIVEDVCYLDARAERLIEGGGARRPDEYALADVALVETPDGRPLWCADVPGLLAAARVLERRRLGEAYAELAYAARATGDRLTIERLLATALSYGSESRRLASVEKVLANLERRSGEIDLRKLAAIEADEAALVADEAGVVWQHFEALTGAVEASTRLAVLRLVLDLDPGHPGASAVVWDLTAELLAGRSGVLVEMFDVDRRGEGESSAGEWLEYLRVASAQELAFVNRPEADVPGISDDERALGQAAARWRPDLFGVRSAELRILTPVRRPGPLARCVDLGELVCRVLDGLFEGVAVERTPMPRPLSLYLYGDQEEYLAKSARVGRETHRGVVWQAGHYDPLTNLQHIYLPETRADFESAMSTYSHELTHNWLQMRCPLYEAGAARASVSTPGFWIVEGFADFVQEFRWDPARGTADPWNPRAVSLDTVANALPEELLPWSDFYAAPQATFTGLSPEPTYQIPLQWTLGRYALRSDKGLFYAQAAATCHYLYHADGGARREALLRFIAAYYTGREEGLDIAAELGLTAEQLGEQVVAFAREAVDG